MFGLKLKPYISISSFAGMLSWYGFGFAEKDEGGVYYSNNPSSLGINIVTAPFYVGIDGIINAAGILGVIGEQAHFWNTSQSHFDARTWRIWPDSIWPYVTTYGFSLGCPKINKITPIFSFFIINYHFVNTEAAMDGRFYDFSQGWKMPKAATVAGSRYYNTNDNICQKTRKIAKIGRNLAKNWLRISQKTQLPHRETDPTSITIGRVRIGTIESETVGMGINNISSIRPIVATDTHMPQRSGIQINISTAGKIEWG